jgi:hypothetical protein
VLCVIDRSGGHHRPLDEAGLAIRSVFDLTFLDSVARPG